MNNEQTLLSYLEEQVSQTKASLNTQNHNLWYWRSGNHIKENAFKQLTNSQVDFFISEAENRIKPLQFRLEWLESQIQNLKK